MEAEKVRDKLGELYPFLKTEEIGVTVLPKDDQWLVFFEKEGHEEVFTLPGDFVDSCVEQGFCHLFRNDCTQALGRLMEAVRSHKLSAALVVARLKQLVPELNDPAIIIAVSEDDPLWFFFMTRTGVTRPVEYKLPVEVVERCLEQHDCTELRKASLVAYHCLMGD